MIRSLLTFTLIATWATLPADAQDLPLPISEIQRSEPVDFATEIMPVLKRNCVACHHEKEAEGGLVLENLEKLLAGGDSGHGVMPRNVEDSLVFARAAGIEEPLMPPEDNAVGAKPLTPEELGLLKKWIEQGAVGSASSGQQMIEFQPIPESIRTVYALDVSADGRVAAIGRGNRIVLVDVASGTEIGQLVDPDLPGDNTAALDLVQSIAASPTGDRIATGGFRTVRIWKKTPVQPDTQGPMARAIGHAAIAGDTLAMINEIGDIEIWNTASNQRTHTLAGHQDPIVTLAITSAADLLLSAGQSGKLAVWNVASGEKVAEHKLGAMLTAATLAPGGTLAAALDADGKVHLMTIDRANKSLQPIDQGESPISGASAVTLAGTENPTLIVAAGNLVHVYATGPLKQQRQIDTGAAVLSVAVSADATKLVSGGQNGQAKLWNLADGKLLQTMQGDPKSRLRLLQAEQDAQRQKAEVTRLNARSDELKKLLEAENEVVKKATEEHGKAKTALETESKKHADAVAVVTTTESKIAAATQNESAAMKTIEESGKQLVSAKATSESIQKELAGQQQTLQATQQEIAKAQAAIDELMKAKSEAMAKAQKIEKEIADKQAALQAAQKTATEAQQQQDAAKQLAEKSKAEAEAARKELEAQKKAAADAEAAKKKSEEELAKRQQALAAATNAQQRAEAAIPAHQQIIDEETRRQKLIEAQHVAMQSRLQNTGNAITAVAFNADASRVATGHRDGELRVYRTGDGLPLIGEEQVVQGELSQVTFVGGAVTALSYHSPAAQRSDQFTWQLETKVGSVDDADTLSDRVTALDFRRDGLSLAVGSGPPSRFGQVKVFAIPSGQLVRDFGEVHSDTVLSLQFSPDGDRIASAAADKTIRLLDVASGEMMRSLEGHTHHVLGVSWQDDGQTLASASADQTIKIWNTETGEQRRTISGFNKELTAVSFVQTTPQLASACADGNVRLYNSADGKAIRTFGAGGDFLFTLQVTPDGTKLIAGGQSGVVRIWNLADGKVLSEIK